MLDPQTERLIKTILRELSARRNLWILLAIVISAGALTYGFVRPKQYTSTASILVENNNIVGPLMDGVAEQTEVSYMAAIVSELVFSRRLLNNILIKGGWVTEDTREQEREAYMQSLIDRTTVRNRGRDLINLTYTDSDPQRAFEVTNMYIEWILRESRESQRQESMAAYNFIDSQVQEYHRKLVEAEVALKNFRSLNLDALPESSREVGARAMDLRREAESLRLELTELAAQQASLRQQLSGEALTTNALSEENDLRGRLGTFERELSTLRLSYHDTYPDIVRVKGQIAEIKDQLRQLEAITGGIQGGGSSDGLQGSGLTLYEDLRGQLASTRTQESSARVRLRELESLLQLEIGRSQKIGNSESTLMELNRDYEVNQDIYQDLLRRRERARVSMTMDQQDQGLMMSVQEPPVVPYTPSGLRFMHIAMAGLALSLLAPLALSTVLVQLDPRVRMKEQIEQLQLPVLTTITHMKTPSPRQTASNMAFVVGILALAAMYGIAAWYKLTGVQL